MAVHKVLAIFEAVDKISKVALKIGGNLGKLEGVSKKTGKAIAAGFAVGAGAAIAFGVSSIKVASEFQDQLAIMSTATKDFGVDMGTLRETALAVGGDTRLIGVSATGAADAITGLAKAGLSSVEVFGDLNAFLEEGAELGGALRASIDLAAATELDMVQASELAAVALATFGGELETAEERAEFVNSAMDNMVKAADASVASVSGLADAMKNVGPTAASFGFSLEDTNNALAILSTRGIEGGEAGTALKSMMTNLMRPTSAVKGALKELNVTLFDSAGNMKSLPEIIGALEVSMAGLTQEQRLAAIQTLAGTFGMKAMSTLLGEGVEGWDAMAEATANASGIQEQAAAKSATFAGKMEGLEGVIETLQIRVGEALLPVLSRFVDWAAEMATARGPELVALFTTMAGVLDTLVSAFIGIVEWLIKLDANQVKVVAGLVLFVAGISPAISAVKAFQTALAVTKTVIVATKAAMAAMNISVAASVAPLLAVAAAVVAVGLAAKAVNDFNKKLAKGYDDVADATSTWAQDVQAASESGQDLSSVAADLATKINGAADAMDEGGKVADLFIDQEKVLATAAEDAGNALLEQAIRADESYNTYITAIDGANASIEAQSGKIEALTNVQWENVKAQDAQKRAADQLKFAELEQGMAAEAAGWQRRTATQQYIEASSAAEELVVVEEALAVADTEVATTGLELSTIMGMLESAYEATGTSAGEVAARTQDVDLAMGTTSNAAVKLNTDMQLISSAFAEGSLSLEAYSDFAQQAEAGTLDLSSAQIAGISLFRDQAVATREAAQAADEYRLAMLGMSESLKDVGAQQAAQIALQGLEQKFSDGLLSLDQYEAAVISVQDTYELATPQSRALAEGMTALNDMLAAGVFAPTEYAAAVEAMRLAAEGGESSVDGLLGAAEAVVGPLNAAGNAAVEAGDKMATITDGANQATAALEAMTGKDWIVKVGTSGSLPAGIEPVALATGAWNIPDEMLALLHPGEMVLPKELADAVRNGSSGGSRQEHTINSGDTFVLNFQGSTQGGADRDEAAGAMREIEVAAQLRR